MGVLLVDFLYTFFLLFFQKTLAVYISLVISRVQDIALVELSSSNEEADNEVIWEDSEEDSDLDDYVPEVTEENLKIPGSGVGKKAAGIQVLDNLEKVDISAPATCGKK